MAAVRSRLSRRRRELAGAAAVAFAGDRARRLAELGPIERAWLAGYAAAQRDALAVLGGRSIEPTLSRALAAGQGWPETCCSSNDSQYEARAPQRAAHPHTMVRMATPGRITEATRAERDPDSLAADLGEARELLVDADLALSELLELIVSGRVDVDVLTRAERARIRISRFVETP